MALVRATLAETDRTSHSDTWRRVRKTTLATRAAVSVYFVSAVTVANGPRKGLSPPTSQLTMT
jgi:hypothetical protein